MRDWPVDIPPELETLLLDLGLQPESGEDVLQDALLGILLGINAQVTSVPDDSSLLHWIRHRMHVGERERNRWSGAEAAVRRAAEDLCSEVAVEAGITDLEDLRLPERARMSVELVEACRAFLETPMSLAQAEDEIGLFPHQDPVWLERDWSPDADVPLTLTDITRDVDYESALEESCLTGTVDRLFAAIAPNEQYVLLEHFGFEGPPKSVQEISRSLEMNRPEVMRRLSFGLLHARESLGWLERPVTYPDSAGTALDGTDREPGRPHMSRRPQRDLPAHDDQIEPHLEALGAAGDGEAVRAEDLVAMSSSTLSADELMRSAREDSRLSVGSDGRIRFLPPPVSRVPAAWRWTPPRGERRRQMRIAVDVLRSAGRPLPYDDLEAAVGALFTTRKLRNNLSGAEGINRADRDTFALVEWGHEPYDSVESLMKRHIERSGGEARLSEIISDLTSRFTIKETTVRVYAKTDAFIGTSTGSIRVRRPEEEVHEVAQPVSAIPRCFMVDGRRSLLIPIDEKLLRGFSPTVPPGFAHHLDVKRQSSVLLETDTGHKVSVIRKGMSDSMGRLRPIAEELGLQPGDLLVASASRGGSGPLSFAGIEQRDLESRTPAERLTLLMGLEGPADTHNVAKALDMPARSTATTLAGALRVRGEPDLAEQVLEVLGGGSPEGPAPDEFADLLGL